MYGSSGRVNAIFTHNLNELEQEEEDKRSDSLSQSTTGRGTDDTESPLSEAPTSNAEWDKDPRQNPENWKAMPKAD
jgi:hypothetical protein